MWYVIKQRFIHFILYWECVLLFYTCIQILIMFLAHYTESAGNFGAYAKKRYSKGAYFISFLSFIVLFIIIFNHDMNSSDLGCNSKTASSCTHSSLWFFQCKKIYLSPLPHMLVWLFMYMFWYMIYDSSFEGGSYCFVKLWGQRGEIQRGGTLSWAVTCFKEFGQLIILVYWTRMISNSYCFQTHFSWSTIFWL